MRLVREENSERTNRSITKDETKVESGFRKLYVALTKSDVQGFKNACSFLRSWDYQEVVMKCIEGREQLEEITLTEGPLGNQAVYKIPKELYEQLEKEASKLQVSIDDYVRAIIYTTGEQGAKKWADSITQSIKNKKDNRVIMVSVPINKELREQMYRKFGKQSDEELTKFLKPKILDFLNEIE